MFKKKFTIVFLAMLLTILLIAGCSHSTEKQDSEKPDSASKQEQQTSKESQKVTLSIYFAKDANGKVETQKASRNISLKEDTPIARAEKALELLQQGPSQSEQEQGLSNSVPEVALLGIDYQRPYLTLNFPKEFAQIGGSAQADSLIKQLTMTMTSIPGIKGLILEVEGKRTGTEENPFTGEGLLFGDLTPPVNEEPTVSLSPADSLDLFIAVIPETEKMWGLMGPKAREMYKSPGGIEFSAFSEGLGSWRDYEVTEEKIDGDTASVTIKGDQVLEGQKEPDATYTAYMVKINGQWKWDFPPERQQ